MGEDAASTVEEIEVIRGRLDGELAELDRRIPGPAALASRLKIAAFAGVVVVGALWLTLRGVRRRAIAGRVQAVVELVPDDIAERLAERMAEALDETLSRRAATI